MKKYNQQGSSSILNNFYYVFRKSAYHTAWNLLLMPHVYEVSTLPQECGMLCGESLPGKLEDL